MKISASKLIANRANAAKSTGPRSVEGKRISSENAQRHGLASSSGVSLDFGIPALVALMEEARGLGFSASEAEELVTRLAAGRDIIDAKHESFKEKPLRGKPLPVYGKGTQVRDWLFVEDHSRALIKVVTEGTVGETYNIGGHNEKQNIEVVKAVCELLDELRPSAHKGIKKYEELITFVQDRPGHDIRYAIDASKIERELGWKLTVPVKEGFLKFAQDFGD